MKTKRVRKLTLKETGKNGERIVKIHTKGPRPAALRLTVQYGYSLTDQGKQALEDALEEEGASC